ncbi:MAG: TIGR04086 family membrane protein [Clostridiales bacterium]|nr:TIGR04086 family membrane protein [Clostridiales bacterium]
MKSARGSALLTVLKGLLVAAGVTLAGMLLLSLAVVLLGVSDGALSLMNQLLKLVSVLLGVRIAVGLGGTRGFVIGATVALLYMAIGYALYWKLGGAVFSMASMLGEMLLGGAVGAASGAVFANLKPRTRRRAKAA